MKVAKARSTLSTLAILMCIITGVLILSACASVAVASIPLERGVAPVGPEFDSDFPVGSDQKLGDHFGPADPVVLLARILRQLGLAEQVLPRM
jgi:hypothetical protein